MNFQPNTSFADLPHIGVNDIIHLIADDDILLKCQILTITPESMAGVVLSVHHSDPSKDWKLKAGPGIELVGKHLNFSKQFVHALIPR